MVQTRHGTDVVRTGSWPPETPVGIEPTITGLQPVAWPFGSSVKYPRQESNLIPDLRRVVCDPLHPEDKSIPARIRTGIQTLEESDVAPLHHQDKQEPMAGFAPAWVGLRDRCLSQSSHIGMKQERKDLNPVKRLWRPPALPGAHSRARVSGGNRTRRHDLHRVACQTPTPRTPSVVPAGFEPAIFPMSRECPTC
jgi:hypothetical protein